MQSGVLQHPSNHRAIGSKSTQRRHEAIAVTRLAANIPCRPADIRARTLWKKLQKMLLVGGGDRQLAINFLGQCVQFCRDTLFLILNKSRVALAAARPPLNDLVDPTGRHRVMQYRILAVPTAVDIDPEVDPILQFGRTGERLAAAHLVLLDLNKCLCRFGLQNPHQQNAGKQPSDSRLWQIEHSL